MEQSSIFSLRRFIRLMLNDLLANKKALLIAALSVFAYWSTQDPRVLVRANTLSSLAGQDFAVLNSSGFLFGIALFFAGFILTSRSFRELHRTELAYHYLTLPCSNFERFLSKFLITSVGYVTALLGLFFVHNIIHGFTVFDSRLWVIGYYMVLHSWVLLGAALFKRYNLVLTYASYVIISFSVPDFVFTMTGLWIALVLVAWFLTYLRVKKYEMS